MSQFPPHLPNDGTRGVPQKVMSSPLPDSLHVVINELQQPSHDRIMPQLHHHFGPLEELDEANQGAFGEVRAATTGGHLSLFRISNQPQFTSNTGVAVLAMAAEKPALLLR